MTIFRIGTKYINLDAIAYFEVMPEEKQGKTEATIVVHFIGKDTPISLATTPEAAETFQRHFRNEFKVHEY